MKKFNMAGFVFVIFCIATSYCAYAQTPPAPDAKEVKGKAADGKDAKGKAVPEAPKAFWAATLPKVTGKIEQRYDINRDDILQTSETKIFLRDVVAEVLAKNSYNVGDSALLKAYDKNKDGIISRLEILVIKADLAY